MINQNQSSSIKELVTHQRKKWYQRWWLWLLLGFLIYFFIVGFLLNINTPDSNQSVMLNEQDRVNNENLLYLNSSDDPQTGPATAKVKLVEFADFQCPYCREAFSTVREVIAKYQEEIHFIYRDFPLSDIHPMAQPAAEAGQCANDQGKFWQLHDKIFINQDELSAESLNRFAKEVGLNFQQFNQCLNSGKYSAEVIQDFLDGQQLGVKGTPTFFVNGYRLAGVIPKEIFISLIEKILQE